jgi:hypothetical protein
MFLFVNIFGYYKRIMSGDQIPLPPHIEAQYQQKLNNPKLQGLFVATGQTPSSIRKEFERQHEFEKQHEEENEMFKALFARLSLLSYDDLVTEVLKLMLDKNITDKLPFYATQSSEGKKFLDNMEKCREVLQAKVIKDNDMM